MEWTGSKFNNEAICPQPVSLSTSLCVKKLFRCVCWYDISLSAGASFNKNTMHTFCFIIKSQSWSNEVEITEDALLYFFCRKGIFSATGVQMISPLVQSSG